MLWLATLGRVPYVLLIFTYFCLFLLIFAYFIATMKQIKTSPFTSLIDRVAMVFSTSHRGKNHLHRFNSIGRHIPNFFGVLTNGTIRREPAHIRCIQHSLSLPSLLIVPQCIHFTLSIPICLEIRRHQEMI